MKSIIQIITSFLLVSGLAACSQENAGSSHHASQQDAAVTAKDQKSDSQTTGQKDKQTTAKPAVPAPKTKNQAEVPAPKSQSQTQTQTVANQVPVTLVETVDGDTIKVNYFGRTETVRYLLVDTPEDKKPNTCIQPYSLEAAKRNNQLLTSGKLTLEFDHGSQRDKYGRLLAYVFVNGSSVQETLLKEGYARVAYIYEPPYKYLSRFQADESSAKQQHLNIWSKPGYATDRGFVGCVKSSAAQSAVSAGTYAAAKTPPSTSSKTVAASKTAGAASTSHAPATASTTAAASAAGATEYFANCTELRKKYPNGVPKGHPAYQARLDRDKDGFACEKN